MFRYFIGIIFVLTLATMDVDAAQSENEWSEPYRTLLIKLSTDPSQVLRSLKASSIREQRDKTQLAQYHYTLSKTHVALSANALALEHAQIALSLLDSDLTPWLFHNVRLAESLALDLNGRSREGLVGANAALVWGELQQENDLIIYSLYVRGLILNRLFDHGGALRDLQRAYELAPAEGAIYSKGAIAGLIAKVHEFRREYALAIPFFKEAVNYHRLNDHWLELSVALYGLGRANRSIGDIDAGIEQLRDSANIARRVNDTQGVGYALKELGGMEITRKQFSRAEALLKEALQIFDESGNRYMQLDCALSLAIVAMKRDQAESAKHYLDLAYTHVEPETMALQKLNIDEQKAHYFALIKEHEKAFDLLQKTVILKQKLDSQRSTEQLNSLRSQYEISAKKRENEVLEQKNTLQKVDLETSRTKYWQLMLLFGSSLIISSLLIVLVYRTKQNRAKLEKLANVDGLTGLNNRRYTLELLETQADLAARHELELSVAIADLDHFKQINDTFGHAAGDRVLKAFGRLCRDTFRHSDIVGRIGGEEFIIALPLTSLVDAKKALKSLSLKVKELGNNLDIEGLNLSISCGLSGHSDELDVAEMMVRADKALYQAKQNGRNRVEVYES